MTKKTLGFVFLITALFSVWACAGRSGPSIQAVVIVSANAEWAAVKKLFPGQACANAPFGEYFLREVDLPDGTGRTVAILHGGWGKTSAAASTQYAVDRWDPGLLINLGTCGGFEGAVDRGTIILAEKTVIYDVIERMGDAEEAVKDYASEIDLGWLRGKLPVSVLKTVLVSADQDIDPKAVAMLRAKYGAVAADWESGAIAYVARRNGKRLLMLRGVSDLVSETRGEAYGDPEVFKKNSESIMKSLFESLPLWLQLDR